MAEASPNQPITCSEGREESRGGGRGDLCVGFGGWGGHSQTKLVTWHTQNVLLGGRGEWEGGSDVLSVLFLP